MVLIKKIHVSRDEVLKMGMCLPLRDKENKPEASIPRLLLPILPVGSLQGRSQRKPALVGKDGSEVKHQGEGERMGQTYLCREVSRQLCFVTHRLNTWNFELNCLAAQAHVRSCRGEHGWQADVLQALCFPLHFLHHKTLTLGKVPHLPSSLCPNWNVGKVQAFKPAVSALLGTCWKC